VKRTIESYRSRFQNKTRAEKYAKRVEEDSRKNIDRREQRAVEKIFSALKDCKTVLDVPSGAGRFLPALSGAGRRVIEMDVSLEILLHAAGRATKLKLDAVFAQGDASRLPFGNDSVDAVFCNRLLHHILVKDERALILRELHRIARRTVVVSFFDYNAFGGIRKFLKKLKGSDIHYDGQPTLEQFRQEVTECGFKVVEIVRDKLPWVSQKFFVMEKN